MGFPDLYSESEIAPSVAPQQLAAAGSVQGAVVDVADRESVVMELSLGSLAGAPTGGTVTLIPMEGNQANGSDQAQVNGTDSVVGNYNDVLPEVLRYRYTGGVNGKLRYVSIKAVAALTGGTSPTIDVSGNVLKGGLRFAGKQPTAGSYPQTPGGALGN